MTSLQLTAKEEMVEKFLDAAARGDLTQASTLLSQVPSVLNQAGYSGWTALMLAARNGHYDVAEMLLSHGCDKFSVNSSSQTAYDIAKFWGHRHISNLLGRTDDGCQRVLPGSDLNRQENYFSRETLDRLSGKRTDRKWLETKQSDPSTVYLLFSNLSPMVSSSQEDGGSEHFSMIFEIYGQNHYYLYKVRPSCVASDMRQLKIFSRNLRLCSSSSGWKGGKTPSPLPPPPASSSSEGGVQEPPAWFAINTGEDAAELLKRCREKNCSFPKTPNRDLLKLSEEEAGEEAPGFSLSRGSGRSVLAWHSRYSFCPTCGSSTRLEEGGYKRSCLNSTAGACRGFTTPATPASVRSSTHVHRHRRVLPPCGDHAGGPPRRKPVSTGTEEGLPSGMFSCLAGFVEPGETMEEAVRREVEEESGVKVGPVQYVSCQPWPMPSNLMIGCLAVAISTDIKVDENEIEEARWFPRQQVIDSLLRAARPGLTVPPRQTIAHQLIRHWVGMNSNL
ncbi:hypothetical protein INR49_008880 [Caranx melampygus]|nr:hypothetical protein INR49_008880 [Caranx melampygus]